MKHKNKVLMTDKIFKENPEIDKSILIEKLKELLKVDEIIIVPKQPYDIYGHTDGMLRFIDDNTLLVNDISIESESYINKLFKTLEKHNLDFVQITYPESFLRKHEWGAYLNFIEIDNIIFMPVYGMEEDKYTVDFIETIFEDKTVEPVKIPHIIKDGGALHCISWMK